MRDDAQAPETDGLTGRGAGPSRLYTYTLSFTCPPLDEAALRDGLEAVAGVTRAIVERRLAGYADRHAVDAAHAAGRDAERQCGRVTSSGGPGPGRAVAAGGRREVCRGIVLEAAARHGVFVMTDILQLGGDRATPDKLRQTVAAMAAAGQIRRLAHGVYGRPDLEAAGEAEIEAMRRRRRGLEATQAEARALKMLTEPMDAPSLRVRLGVSRQRIDQLLAKMMEKGLAARTSIDGVWVIHLPGADLSAFAARVPRTDPGLRDRILRRLPRSGWAKAADVAGGRGATVDRALEILRASGAVELLRLKSRRFVRVTPAGAALLGDGDRERAAPVALEDALGEPRATVLQALALLSPCPTWQITAALKRLDPARRDQNTTTTLNALRELDLACKPAKLGPAQSDNAITDLGRMVVGAMPSRRLSLTSEAVIAAVAARRAEMAALGRLQAAGAHPSGLTAVQRAAMAALEAHGPIQARALLAYMTVRPRNPRSINLSLGSLADRGLVARAQEGRSVLYLLTPEGRTMLSG